MTRSFCRRPSTRSWRSRRVACSLRGCSGCSGRPLPCARATRPRSSGSSRTCAACRTSRWSRSSAPARWSSSWRTSPRSASASGAGASTTRRARSSASRWPRRPRSCAATTSTSAPLAAQLEIEHVLTAHPTEATRRSVLDHQWDVAKLLDRLDDPRTGKARRRALVAALRETLTVWWQTDELRRVRPKVEDEVRRNLFFIEAVLFDAVPAVLDEIEHSLGVRLVQPVLSYGSWTGGDMDGHPEVGADTLASALQLHRVTALRLLRVRVDHLARVFSHSSLRIPISLELEESLKLDAEELPSADVLRRPHHEWEPLRTKLGFVAHRLVNTGRPRGREPGYADAQALRRDLELVLAHLGSRHVALGSIRRLLWQVDVFGFHLAGIDIRQGAGVVREAASALLPGYAAADEERRVALLSEALVVGAPRHPARPGRRGRRAAARPRHRRAVRRGLRAAGRARVRDLDDRAAVGRPGRAVAGPAGGRDARCGWCRCSRPARRWRRRRRRWPTLYECEPYVAHLRTQANRQTVMVGYSDSGKDTGLRRLAVGAVQRAGAAGGAGARGRRDARALPRPRRLPLARRRAHLPGDPGPAGGHGAGPDPDHRAGRDGLRPLRRPGAGRAIVGADRLRGAAGQRAAEPADPSRVARGDGAPLGRLARRATARSSTTTRNSCASSARWRRSPSCPN